MNSSVVKRAIGTLTVYAILAVTVVIVFVPIAWAVGTSFKPFAEVYTRAHAIFPTTLQWENYIQVFRVANFQRYFLNTLLVSGAVCAITLTASSMAAYAFARLRFPGRETLFLLYLSTLIIPPQVVLIPNFVIMRELNLLNSLTALVLTRAFLPLGTFLLRQFFLGIPKELEESAVMDGCGYARRFIQIVLPLAKPALATLLIITLLQVWNDYLYPLVFIQSDAKRTLTLGLAILMGDFDVQWNLVMAATILSVLPLVVIYLFLQRFFIEGIALSGTKG